MKPLVKLFALSALFLVTLFSCTNEESIQTYFVGHQDEPEFLMIDLSPKMIDISQTELDDEQRDVYNSFKKVNILGYKVDKANKASYVSELEKAKTVFKNKDYSELMEFSDNGIKFRVSTIGNNDEIDEFILLASSEAVGFAVVRVIGDNMQPEKLVHLMEKMKDMDVDGNQLGKVMDYFNN
ncbi:DUF4252 domain-containing protein [Bizionia gelidisalsuginis]|uniref:DUF4252 domain-containing protein n=1 Tax=Bizionia gelidisalsuginis TaxID=291188 RepID=A0ABY3ME74_9FLAO|nr:DUF4252 domain-containing protein [Bizionia gelidisalsuginis]TYC17911.1 DUF4252 domain-containing protein [Bizionia gelidisalsuginis]